MLHPSSVNAIHLSVAGSRTSVLLFREGPAKISPPCCLVDLRCSILDIGMLFLLQKCDHIGVPALNDDSREEITSSS